MRHILPMIILALTAGIAAAAPAQGVYASGSSRFLTVDAATDTSFQFSLAVGAAEGGAKCSEGDVSCLSIDGEAKASAEGFVYTNPDGEGQIAFELGTGRIQITNAAGTLGSGSGNARQLYQITGVYEQVAQQASDVNAKDEYVLFQTPTGNISCAIYPDKESVLRCDMQELKQSYTERPSDCDLDWGTAFGISENGRSGEVICHGDTLFGTDPMKLEYGKTLDVGGFKCFSEKTGLTCKNADGHGFTLSKARQKLF